MSQVKQKWLTQEQWRAEMDEIEEGRSVVVGGKVVQIMDNGLAVVRLEDKNGNNEGGPTIQVKKEWLKLAE